MRAYVQHGMQTLPQPVKVTTTGPMFRYDRPAGGPLPPVLAVRRRGDRGPGAGRRRRDHRARRTGSTRRPASPGVEVLVNSIGDPACRPAYIAELVGVLPRPRRRAARRRSATASSATPLRLLDSKDPAMVELNAAAPRITDHLCEACAAHFASVKAHLEALGVPFRVEPALVRGPRLLHAHGVRVLRRGPRGPAAGAGRRRPLRRARGAAGRQADARASGSALGLDRVAARARGAGARDRRPPTGRSPSSRARTRTTPSGACASRRSCGPPGSASAPTSAGASSGASSRPRARTGRTSR